MLTNVYIDAFNLYYGSLKKTAYRWLNIRRLAELEFPSHQINHIHYCTALVKPRLNNPGQDLRQQVYLRALKTLPSFTIHYGHYLVNTVRMPYATPPVGGPNTVEVIKSEEKGSDVNIATQLLVDAFDDDFEQAVVVSNDSDLAGPIEVVRKKFMKPVVVLFPCRHPRKPSYRLSSVATSSPIIKDANLAVSQFPASMTDATGNFYKPPAW